MFLEFLFPNLPTPVQAIGLRSIQQKSEAPLGRDASLALFEDCLSYNNRRKELEGSDTEADRKHRVIPEAREVTLDLGNLSIQILLEDRVTRK